MKPDPKSRDLGELLDTLAQDSCPQARAKAAEAFVWRNEQREDLRVAMRLAEALRDPDENVRADIAEALRFGFPEVAPTLAAGLQDPSHRVRIRCLIALGELALPEHVPLLQQLLHDADPEVRDTAAYGLSWLPTEASHPARPSRLQRLKHWLRSRLRRSRPAPRGTVTYR